MIDVPWFMLSPSPVSLIQYAVLTYFVARKLSGAWWKRAVQGILVTMLFVLIGDAIWAGLCSARWISLFPQDAWQIITSFLRDILGAGVMFLMIGDLFLEKKLRFDGLPLFFLFVCFCFQLIWFTLAPSPAFTDYTFAWRHGYSLDVVFVSWILGHWIMRIPLWLGIWAILKNHNGYTVEKMEESDGSQCDNSS